MKKNNTKNNFIFLMCLVLMISTVLCCFSAGFATMSNNGEYNTQPTDEQTPTYAIDSKGPINIKQGDSTVIVLSKDDEEALSDWTSSAPDVVAVDDGGRIDALEIGTSIITAQFGSQKSVECTVTVTEADGWEYDGYSTAILANSDILEKNKSKESTNDLYQIKVNRKQNCVTVYTYDDDGNYTVPVRAMVCSCGLDNSTLTGEFGIYFKNEWNALFNNVYGHYVSGISGDYLFHSVPFYTSEPDTLEVDEFNKLGSPASLGCVRMATADVKWIYENCPQNTIVNIYDDNNCGPLGKPEAIKITDQNCGWDPTDDDNENPYNNKKPQIKGAVDCTLPVGGEFYPLTGITATDTCSNDITEKISVVGNVITSHTGTYKVTYSVEDVMHRSTTVDITVTVK